MQMFEVDEMYIVGRPTSFFPYKLWLLIRCDDFESDYNYNTLYVIEVSFSFNIS